MRIRLARSDVGTLRRRGRRVIVDRPALVAVERRPVLVGRIVADRRRRGRAGAAPTPRCARRRTHARIVINQLTCRESISGRAHPNSAPDHAEPGEQVTRHSPRRGRRPRTEADGRGDGAQPPTDPRATPPRDDARRSAAATPHTARPARREGRGKPPAPLGSRSPTSRAGSTGRRSPGRHGHPVKRTGERVLLVAPAAGIGLVPGTPATPPAMLAAAPPSIICDLGQQAGAEDARRRRRFRPRPPSTAPPR